MVHLEVVDLLDSSKNEDISIQEGKSIEAKGNKRSIEVSETAIDLSRV